jgi:hypothetical protein
LPTLRGAVLPTLRGALFPTLRGALCPRYVQQFWAHGFVPDAAVPPPIVPEVGGSC